MRQESTQRSAPRRPGLTASGYPRCGRPAGPVAKLAGQNPAVVGQRDRTTPGEPPSLGGSEGKAKLVAGSPRRKPNVSDDHGRPPPSQRRLRRFLSARCAPWPILLAIRSLRRSFDSRNWRAESLPYRGGLSNGGHTNVGLQHPIQLRALLWEVHVPDFQDGPFGALAKGPYQELRRLAVRFHLDSAAHRTQRGAVQRDTRK
jgi:hypothetical protein